MMKMAIREKAEKIKSNNERRKQAWEKYTKLIESYKGREFYQLLTKDREKLIKGYEKYTGNKISCVEYFLHAVNVVEGDLYDQAQILSSRESF